MCERACERKNGMMIEMTECVLISFLLSQFPRFHNQIPSAITSCFIIIISLPGWTQTRFLIGRSQDDLFPCESAGMWGMTCTIPGPFPPSSHLPFFRHSQVQLLFHFSLFFLTLSSFSLLTAFLSLLKLLFFPHTISSFLSTFSSYPLFSVSSAL